MSSCCTPEYIKLAFLSPAGDVKLKRGTGNAPSCGYYENYTGTPSLNNYDYYVADIQYNSGSGFWTFSGSSTGFNDDTVYRSVETGNPCNPIGSYTGGIYSVFVERSDKWGLKEFEPSYTFDNTNIGSLGLGSGVHLEKDVTFKASVIGRDGRLLATAEDMARSPYLNGVIFDIIDTDGAMVYKNYFSGYKSSIKITEEENIKLFGSYQKDFGVRVTTLDSVLGEAGKAEIYAYGNALYLDSLTVADDDGTTTWETDSLSESGSTTGAAPSGFLREKLGITANFSNQPKYVNPKSISIYASETSDFETSESNKIKTISLIGGKSFQNIEINESWGLIPNKDYWFALRPESKVAVGNTTKIGPHKIKQKKGAPSVSTVDYLNISDGVFNFSNNYRNSSLATEVTGGSGIVDKLIVDTGNFGSESIVYSGVDFDFRTIPTTESGEWKKTTFNYDFEFKDSSSPYSNVSKRIKLTATGASVDPFNSGMPVFGITDYDTGVSIDIGIQYLKTGFNLLVETGIQYDKYKYYKTSF